MRETNSRPEVKEKRAIARRGIKSSAETKEKIRKGGERRRERQGGVWHLPESIEKMSQTRINNPIKAWEGMKLPESIKDNMRKGWIKRKEKYGASGRRKPQEDES